MEITAIIYKSGTGFTARYAKILAQKCNLPVFDLKTAKKKLPRGGSIAYLGWIFATKISGYEQAKTLFDVKVVGACGMSMPTEDYLKQLKANNQLEEVFYLRGGIDRKKLGFMKKMMLNMVASSIEKEAIKKEENKEEYELISLLRNGGDYFSEEQIDSLVEFLK